MSQRGTAAVKYRDPKRGATWTGHGWAPSWIAAAKNRDKFLVDGGAATARPAPVSKVKTAGNYVRGPQPAMYQDPKSGATWSGRGRAPAWIANVKDRSKLLIAGGAEATVAANAGVVSKAKAAVKKASKAVGATSTKGQPKGPQPAKYHDPKSGATWSGRGPAPAWLAAVKDRTRFLIEGSSAVTPKIRAENKASKANAAGKSGAVSRKATVKKVAVTKASPAKKTVVAKKVSAKEAPATKAVVAARNTVAVKKDVAPGATKAAVKKAPAKKTVANTVVAKPGIAVPPTSVTVQATA